MSYTYLKNNSEKCTSSLEQGEESSAECFAEELKTNKKKNMNKFKTLEVLFTHCQSDDDHPMTAADQGKKVSECDWLLNELEDEEKTPDVLGATIVAAKVGSLSGDEIEAFIQVKL